MSNDDWKTLRVPPDAYERAQEQRKAAGRTWGEQIVRPENDTVEDRLARIERRLDELSRR